MAIPRGEAEEGAATIIVAIGAGVAAASTASATAASTSVIYYDRIVKDRPSMGGGLSVNYKVAEDAERKDYCNEDKEFFKSFHKIIVA